MAELFTVDTEKPDVHSHPSVRDDAKFSAGKIGVFQYVTVGVFLFLISGFWQLQIQNENIYSEAAARNRIKSIPILAPRGRILDRDGRTIVDNHSSFSLILSRENLRTEHLRPIADGLNLDYDDLVERLHRFRRRPRYEPIIVKEELTRAELAFVNAHRDPETFPEMELIEAQRRLYPRDGLGAHVLGYVGEVSESELNTPEFAKYEPGDVIGKYGIERQYNAILMGIDGARQVLVDNRGRERQQLDIKEAVPGKDLQLTIDLDLQVVAELAMEGRRGAVVALDPRNGEVLAMVSRPAYDPNRFAGRIRASDWKEIVSNPENPLLNRAIQGQLAPGSTFKPIIALAGLQYGVITDDFRVRCSGGASFYGRYFKCHLKGGHGVVDLHKGIAQSCDVFFYTVGNKLGVDRIAEYAKMAGLAELTGLDLPGEKEGVVPSSAWKMRNFRVKWYAGETISVSIGQGATTVTPLQLARAIGGIATGGVWQTPHLVKDFRQTSTTKRANLNLDNVMKVIDGMYAVVNEGGTGVRARIPALEVCGKTGTAQLASNEVLKGSSLGRSMKDNAWFV
ncbi:MAG TPA: penicillin-binding protein 2, partial [Bryobacteraceae bacterium]|nr:penicillin-binding protein 2 [Bryobacteraceae bacterium]